ncbi:hypothetical protein [Suipraeoptans intestinalis]|uniref:hypothetical protein n=1 Tax=Suipraeoptans intestinalis TaxID=2606628 RepID=UPI0023F43031|nr:hypothetical protein [Suipraeoptans intestinalis]MDD7770424.1 hypothetical protein [Suipraeoptans intestinalis]
MKNKKGALGYGYLFNYFGESRYENKVVIGAGIEIADYDARASELAAKIKEGVGNETFTVIEANSIHFDSYYIYRTGGSGRRMVATECNILWRIAADLICSRKNGCEKTERR